MGLVFVTGSHISAKPLLSYKWLLMICLALHTLFFSLVIATSLWGLDATIRALQLRLLKISFYGCYSSLTSINLILWSSQQWPREDTDIWASELEFFFVYATTT